MTDELLIDLEGVSDPPGVVGMQWGLRNLDIQNLSVIAPVDGGRIIDATNPTDYEYYPYPFSGQGWEAQLAIVQGERGGFYVRNTDNTFQFKQFIYGRLDDAVLLNFGTHNQAPFGSYTTGQSTMWRFNTYAGGWRVPARIYRDWMEPAFNARRLSEKAAWLEDITLFVGSVAAGFLVTDIKQNTEFLDALATKVDPTKTVVMAKEWAKPQEWSLAPANVGPIYDPMPELGDFLAVAKRHGFRVVLYAGMHDFSVAHPLYPEFIQYQYRDTWTGELSFWRSGGEKRNALINPASSAFREILVNELKDVWDTYDFDGFVLDTSFYAINDANGLIDGLNSVQGGALLYEELAAAMPGAVFSGERLHEGTFALDSLAQRPLITDRWDPHPISSFLFSPFTHAISHARYNPDLDPIYYQNVLDYSEVWGIMPTLNVWYADQLLLPEWPNSQEVLASAGGWQSQYGLDGDINGDGMVNIFDLTLVARNVGIMPLTRLQTDVNGDGQVNVMDLILVANMFGR